MAKSEKMLRVSFSVPAELWGEFSVACDKNDRPKSRVLRQLARQYIAEQEGSK